MNKRTIALGVVGLLVWEEGVLAQQTFVPIELDQQGYNTLWNALGELPAKYALPIMGQLQGMELAAQARATKPLKPNAKFEPKK